MTDARQLIWAVTTTLEYQHHAGRQLWLSRLEYRYDDSTGPQGGFFKDGDLPSGMPRLARSQHMILFSLLWAFDS